MGEDRGGLLLLDGAIYIGDVCDYPCHGYCAQNGDIHLNAYA